MIRAFIQQTRMPTPRSRIAGVGAQRIALEPFETSACFMLLPAISVVTFYDADNDTDLENAVDELRSRMDTVLALNPWLVGSLENAARGQRHRYDIVVPTDIPPASTAVRGKKAIFSNVKNALHFQATSPWEAIASATEQYVVRMGRECVATGEPLFRVTAIPLAASSSSLGDVQAASPFAVVVSMSHVLGDGASLYQLIGMLGKDGQVRALNAIRRPYTRPPWEAWCSSRVLVGCFVRTVFGPRKRAGWARISRSWISSKKAEALTETRRQNVQDEPRLWVSTNDVLTSYLIEAGNFGRAFMAVDLRGELKFILAVFSEWHVILLF
jgi:hypothetical protein